MCPVETNGPLPHMTQSERLYLWICVSVAAEVITSSLTGVFFLSHRCVREQSGVDAESNGTRTESGEFERRLSKIHIQIWFTEFVFIESSEDSMKLLQKQLKILLWCLPRVLWVTWPVVSRPWSTGTWQERTSRKSRLKVRTSFFLSVFMRSGWICLVDVVEIKTQNIQWCRAKLIQLYPTMK